MEILKYIFFLGIVYIVFSIIWFFIALLPKYLLGNRRDSAQNNILGYLIKSVQYYFLASLTAIKAIDFVQEENIDASQGPVYVVIGGIVLYLYLAGKAERNRAMVQFRSNLGNFSTTSLKYEPHLIGITLIFYAIAFNYLPLIQNPINYWFLESIDDFYNTIIIGWIIGFIGFFFLLSMIFKGINTTGFLVQTVINFLTGKPAPKRKPKNPFGKFGQMGKNNPFGNQNPFGGGDPFQGDNPFPQQEAEDANIDDDMYVDFEIIDEDEEEEEDENNKTE